MLKSGIFLDIENLTRNGGWGMRYNVIRDFVCAQGASILRANAYMAIDRLREKEDPVFGAKQAAFRNGIRASGFHPIFKEVKRYRDASGNPVTKANADVDLAIDALLQSDNLDHVVLGTGDGDFLRLVRALQNRGKRVDVLSFSNTSRALRDEADRYFSGFLLPGLLSGQRGVLHHVSEGRDFGFLTVQTGIDGHTRNDIFLHISNLLEDGQRVSNERFAELHNRRATIEFDLVEDGGGHGKDIAENAHAIQTSGTYAPFDFLSVGG